MVFSQPLPTQVPVALHRWFANGENWAHHPGLGLAELQRILTALAGPLERRQRGVFTVKVGEGVVIGELIDDHHCPDPRARDRNPFLLRATLVPFALDRLGEERALAALRALPIPATPGAHPTLHITVERPARPISAPPENEPEPPGPERPSGTRRRWPLLIGSLVLAGTVGSVWLWLQAPGPSTNRSSRAPTTSSNSDDWGSEPSSDPAQRGRWQTWIDRVDHPYTAYLKDNEELLLDPPRPPLVGYDEWRQQRTGRTFRDLNKPLPSGLRQLVDRQRRPDKLIPPARKMAEMMQSWTGKDELLSRAETAPLRVIEAFFRYLTRPPGLPRPGELDHPQHRFLWRLPVDPVAENRVIEDETDLAKSLAELLGKLRGQAAPNGSWQTLLQEIDRELDFAAWVQEQKKRAPFVLDVSDDPGPIVREEFQKKFGRMRKMPTGSAREP